MTVDLHTHSTVSDGRLTPAELIALACKNGVETLSITDHDTLGAYALVPPQIELKLVVGIELSTTWAGHGVHILGLQLDPSNASLLQGIQQQQSARIERAGTIARILGRMGIPDPLAAVTSLAGDSMIGRPHFAQHLVDIGAVKDRRMAFRKYLGAGKPGDVKSSWASLEEVVSWIRAAGGIAVLAHPAKYGLTWSKLRLMLRDFVAVGGGAIEVVCGPQAADVTGKLARIAEDFELAASCGSDFHDPGHAWSRPGHFPPLPDNLPTVWERW